MTTTEVQPWTFNRQYDDLQQVAPFWGGYWTRFTELQTAGRYPYNDDFRGHLGGTFASQKDEDSAIYLLQTRRHLQDDLHLVALAIEDGCTEITAAELEETPRRFSRVVKYGWYMGGTGYKEWADVRLMRHRGGCRMDYVFLLQGRARTRGTLLDGNVLAKA